MKTTDRIKDLERRVKELEGLINKKVQSTPIVPAWTDGPDSIWPETQPNFDLPETTIGLTIGDNVSPLTVGENVSPLTVGENVYPLTVGENVFPLTFERITGGAEKQLDIEKEFKEIISQKRGPKYNESPPK